MRSMLVAMIPTLLLCACGGGDAPPQITVMMGDSITANWDEAAYAVPILARRLPGEINTGVSGDTTDQMVARFKTDVLDRRPTQVVIEGGINDLHLDNYPDALANIVEMGQEASAAAITVYIALIPHSDLSWAGIPETAIPEFNGMLRTACADYGWTCLDYYAATSLRDGRQKVALFERDHTHPNPVGYDAMWVVLKAGVSP